MYRYGFELEGFFFYEDGGSGQIIPPQKGWTYPLDGFPGLCELRTVGGDSLEGAAAQMFRAWWELDRTHVDFRTCEHKFSGADMSYMRKHFKWEKDQIDIGNIYGKKPRALNGKTLASFQINISDLRHAEYKRDNVTIPAEYGMLDIPRIVRRLDEAFQLDITRSKRQPGMYAIKDGYRLEYRSLPNAVWSFHEGTVKRLLEKIKEAVEGE